MIGRLLGGRYTIVENVDVGGMAYIYKAICKKTNQFVAVKVLKEEFSDNPEYVTRFKKEAEAAFSLEHPNIVHVTDIGCDEGTYYMVMEFVEGRPLKAVIEEKGCIDEEKAIRYAAQVCDALEAAHSEGIIHRDIKPHNLLVNVEGQVKITDFGIATSAASREKKASEVMGSVFYISPEQAKGDRVDCRTDIYSLGVVLYEMLTGQLPHTGEKTVAVALKHINEKIIPPVQLNSGISMAVNNVVLKATSKAPKERYRSADALKEDLLRALEEPNGEYVDIPKALTDEARTKARGRMKVWKICVLAALLLIIGGAVYLVFYLFGQTAVDMVEVVDTTGMDAAGAEATLENLGLTVDTVTDSSETVESGIVIKQSIGQGIQVSKGSAITLTVSSGPPVPVMPGLIGHTYEEAMDKLESVGITSAEVTYEVREDVSPGKVVDQMPEAETPITEDELVTITISDEAPQESTLMRSLKGLPIDQAVSQLESMGFSDCLVYEKKNVLAEGIVYDQSPAEGAQVYLTDKVVLYIGEYTTKIYQGVFNETFEVPEKDSKIQIVLVDTVNGINVRFVAREPDATASYVQVNTTLEALSSGTKKVIVYVNNVETYTYEVTFE